MTKDNRAEISMLLPWYAAGTLNAAETRRVAAAIARDPELARRLEDIRLEASEILHLNEQIPAPSRRVADRLFAAIEAEQAQSPRAYQPKFSISAWLAEKISIARPRTLAFAAAAAVAVIALQAGLIAGNFVETAGYEVATAPTELEGGPQILVTFAPTATAADIETLLKNTGATIIEGPKAGLYRVRIQADGQSLDQVIKMLRDRPEIVSFASPAS